MQERWTNGLTGVAGGWPNVSLGKRVSARRNELGSITTDLPGIKRPGRRIRKTRWLRRVCLRTLLLGLQDHALGDAVLDGASSIEELCLGQQVAAEAFLRANRLEPDQRSPGAQRIKASPTAAPDQRTARHAPRCPPGSASWLLQLEKGKRRLLAPSACRQRRPFAQCHVRVQPCQWPALTFILWSCHCVFCRFRGRRFALSGTCEGLHA
jgi:hypothetical protein